MDPGLPNGKVSLARTHSVNASRTRPASRPVGWLACACGHDPALPGPNTRRVRGASFRDLAGPEGPGRPFHGAATSGVSGIGRFVGHDFADFGGRLAGDRAGKGVHLGVGDNRKSVVWGKDGSVRLGIGGSRIMKKKQKNK